jgi:hypothetical protein
MPTQNQGIPDVPTSTIITAAAYFEMNVWCNRENAVDILSG